MNTHVQLRVQYLAQGYFPFTLLQPFMQTGGDRKQTSDLPISRQPTLPPEPQQLQLSFLAQAITVDA